MRTTADRSSDREGAAGALPRKPFIAFTFELPSAAAAQQTPAAPAAQPAAQSTPKEALDDEDDMPAPRPPEGTIAGKWRTPKASNIPLDSVVFCLEVHGEHVRR